MKSLHIREKILLLTLLLVICSGISIFLGPVGEVDWNIIQKIRLPRVFLAIIVGFGLATAGAVLQGVLRNPLADPFILGTSSAATAGVMLAGLVGLRSRPYAVYFFALAFALFSILLVYKIAQTQGKTPVQTLILAGVVVSLFFNAWVFVFFSVFHRENHNVLFFLLGTLTEGNNLKIWISSFLIVAGIIVSWILSRDLNLLTQGEAAAFHLGLPVEVSKKVLFVTASTMVAASVAVAGMIGFVGLITPHLMRMIIGPDHKKLIPASALAGAIFLVLADALARTVYIPLEIPVGAVTALVGSPYFVYLLRTRNRAGEF